MSGRGLGFSGGTLDKLESFPGYRVDLTTDEFVRQLKEIGIVLSGQSKDLAPADGKLYALRDVTGTVQSLPLIASSIMSKKIAAGAQAVVLDVKVGLGAFMKTIEDARALAQIMVSIGEMAGRRVVTVLSDMNQPLGQAVGNILEVREALDTLRGGGPDDFREHCLHVCAEMLVLGEVAHDHKTGRVMAERVLANGAALQKFRTLVAAQGGDVSYIDEPDKFPKAKLIEPLRADKSGFLAQVNAQVIGEESVKLGAGRAKKGDLIDHTVGIIVHRRVGDHVKRGEHLLTIHANDAATLSSVRERLRGAFVWSKDPIPPLPLFYE
jgi:pyrimidine-nucleoside phosphorylase